MSIASSCQEGSACCTNQLAYRVTPCDDDDAFWIRVILIHLAIYIIYFILGHTLWWWCYILQFQCVLQVGQIQQFGKYTFLFFLSFPCWSSWIAYLVHFRQMHSFIWTQMFFASWTNTFCNLENTISSSFYPPPSHVDPHEPLHERRLQGGACLRPIMRQRMQPMLPRVLCSYKFYIFSLSYYGISAFTNMAISNCVKNRNAVHVRVQCSPQIWHFCIKACWKSWGLLASDF